MVRICYIYYISSRDWEAVGWSQIYGRAIWTESIDPGSENNIVIFSLHKLCRRFNYVIFLLLAALRSARVNPGPLHISYWFCFGIIWSKPPPSLRLQLWWQPRFGFGEAIMLNSSNSQVRFLTSFQSLLSLVPCKARVMWGEVISHIHSLHARVTALPLLPWLVLVCFYLLDRFDWHN